MSLWSDLLSQARTLLRQDRNRPKQASLRRAVSAAYYALFHLLAEDAVAALFRGSRAKSLRDVARRAFQHKTMKTAARAVASGNLPEPWKKFFDPPSRELVVVAPTLVDLQEARHQADCDIAHRFTRAEAADLVERVADAFEAWRTVERARSQSGMPTLEARAFPAALLMYDQSRR